MADTNDSIAKNASTPLAKPRISWPHIVFGILGVAISIYATLIHRRIEAGGNSGCGFTETINCDKVLASTYGALFGIPLGVFGMAYFLVVILSAVNTSRIALPRQEALQRLVVASLGLCATLALSYISYGILKAACPICMSTHAVIVITFFVSLWQFLKIRSHT